MTTNLTALYGLGTGGSGKWKSQTFTSSGIWNKPEGVSVAQVLLVGGGGSGASFNQNGNGGGSSGFYADIPVIARGGGGGSTANWRNTSATSYGGPGGGNRHVHLQSIVGASLSGYPALYQTVTNVFTNFGVYGHSFGMDGISSLNAVSGASGGCTFSAYNGGNVLGFGNGGVGSGLTAYYNNSNSVYQYFGSGGGASFGNGGSWLSTQGRVFKTPNELGDAPAGYGGGSASDYMGSGGGGGEIVFRMTPVSNDVTVIIGLGGRGNKVDLYAGEFYYSPCAGNGLCIVFWQE